MLSTNLKFAEKFNLSPINKASRILLLCSIVVLNSELKAQPSNGSSRSVVLTGVQAQALGRQCSRESPQGLWSSVPPSKAEIRRLESALPSFMQAHKNKRWSGRWSDFYYQYGALKRGKKRLIYVNAFAMDTYIQKSWRRAAVTVCDGGNSFWGVEFDPTINKFQKLAFNGMA